MIEELKQAELLLKSVAKEVTKEGPALGDELAKIKPKPKNDFWMRTQALLIYTDGSNAERVTDLVEQIVAVAHHVEMIRQGLEQVKK